MGKGAAFELSICVSVMDDKASFIVIFFFFLNKEPVIVRKTFPFMAVAGGDLKMGVERLWLCL